MFANIIASEAKDKKSLAKRKKQMEKEEMPRAYKKTKNDRLSNKKSTKKSKSKRKQVNT